MYITPIINAHWFTRSETIFDVALEDHSVGFREPEGVVLGLQSRANSLELREDVGLDGTPEHTNSSLKI